MKEHVIVENVESFLVPSHIIYDFKHNDGQVRKIHSIMPECQCSKNKYGYLIVKESNFDESENLILTICERVPKPSLFWRWLYTQNRWSLK